MVDLWYRAVAYIKFFLDGINRIYRIGTNNRSIQKKKILPVLSLPALSLVEGVEGLIMPL